MLINPVEGEGEEERRMTKVKLSVSPAKHVPQRTCIVCHKTVAKRELVRLVSIADGGVQVDLTGKKSGRGAYLCQSPKCWDSALKTGRLEYALHTSLRSEDKEKLENYAKGISNNDNN